MFFALISVLLAPPQRAQAQPREAYVNESRSADWRTLTFYYDDQRATRTGKSWGIEEMKNKAGIEFPAWIATWGAEDRVTARVVFDASFRNFRPTTTAMWFLNCTVPTKIEGLEHLNTSEVKDMREMFSGCSGLTSLDLSHFNTQNVTDMSFMFSSCSGLTSLDVKNFNTQNVTNMLGMFSRCSSLTSLDVSHFNTQNVTDMSGMFSRCSGLTSLDVSHFNTQNVKYMLGMFYYCSALTTIKSNTAWQCPQSKEMFDGCTKLKGAVTYDKSKTDVTMANPETGYFTRSNGGGVEAYVAQSADKTTLTFYYDALRATRTGKSWGIKETKKEGGYTFPAWAGTNQVADSLTARVVFDTSFRDFRPFTTARWFYNYRALKQIEGLEYLNTQNVTDMGWMFSGCSGLTSLDLSHFNTQKVTDMSGMFSLCSGLTSLDLSHFNTQKVTDMSGMFSLCSGLNSLDVSNFNTQKVTDMSWMFYYCSALTTINSNTAWQCPGSTDMFADCTKLKGAVAYDENKTDVTMANPETGYFTRSNDGGVEAYVAQSADKTTLTFYYDNQRATRTGTTWGIEERKEEGNITFPAWAGTYRVADSLTARVVFDASFRDFRPFTTARWFCNYRALKQIEGLEYLNTQNVTNMNGMFWFCSGLTSLDVSHFKTQNVTDMWAMFQGCSGLTSLDVSHFNTQNVTKMDAMFSGCSGLTSLDVSHFNTQNVTSMFGMFWFCPGLTSLDVKNFNTQNVTDMSYMFSGCSGLTSLDVSHFNTQNVTGMSEMFSGCSGLTSLDVSHFNTQNVTGMSFMFSDCSGLTSLDVSHFKTQKVTDMSFMFYGCSALTTINSNTAWQCPISANMFAHCTQLKGAVAYDENNTGVTMANPETGYFTAKPTTVESVRFGADGSQHIYTLQGKRVRGAWKHLPAGVYVVNGKKTVKP